MAPDKVPMDRLTTEDIFIFSNKLNKNGEPEVVKSSRAKTGSGSTVAPSPFTKLYLGLFEQKAGVGSIVYSQSVSAILVALMNQTKFTMKEHEMISNIMDPIRKVPLGWEDEVVVPIVDNTDDIKALLESIQTACKGAKDTNAIIIRNNGILVWGEDWIQARNMLESYLYLMDLSVEMKKLGFNQEGSVSTPALPVPASTPATPVAGGSKQKPTEKVENPPKRKKVEGQDAKKFTKKTENSYKKPAYVKPVVDLALRKKKAALNRLRQDAVGGGHVPFSSITMSGAAQQMNGPRMGPMSGNQMGPMANPTNGPNNMNGPNVGPARNSMDRNTNGPNMGPMNNQNNRGPNGPQGMGPMNGPPGMGPQNNMGRPGPMNGPPGMGPMNNQNNMGPMGRQGILNAPMNGPQGMGPMNGPQGMGPMNGPQGMGPGPQGIMGPMNGPMGMGPGPNNMGPGPNNMMGPGPNNMGPGPNNMGPGPNNMGPGPSNMGPRNGPNQGGPRFNEKFNKYLKGPQNRAGGVKRSGDAASGQPPKSTKFSPKKGATKNKEKFKSVRPEDY